MSYIPPYRITDKILSFVADISEKIGKISERTNLVSKPHLRKNNKIKSIHSSLAIEANSLSLDEVRDVINGRTVMGKQKEIQEVKNAYAAYEEIGRFDIYSINELKRLHGIMTKFTVEESGVTFAEAKKAFLTAISIYLWRRLQALCLSKCKACLTG